MKHLLSLKDWKPEEVMKIIKAGIEIKKNPGKYREALKDRTLLMIFEKPSLRTRVSFETGMTQMGGHGIYYDVATSPLGKKETIEDTARTASRYVDIIMARLLKFADMEALAKNSSVPTMDALSEENHPCQVLADLMTIMEKKGKLKGLKLVYLGDGENNVTYSLLHGCALTGMDMTVGCPDNPEVRPRERFLKEAMDIARRTGSRISVVHNPQEAVKGADIVYTDSWMSYHIPEDRKDERMKLLKPFQVTKSLMAKTNNAFFMHCLPAQRGMEVAGDVIDGPQSIVFDQAENRLHAQKAIMLYLLGKL